MLNLREFDHTFISLFECSYFLVTSSWNYCFQKRLKTTRQILSKTNFSSSLLDSISFLYLFHWLKTKNSEMKLHRKNLISKFRISRYVLHSILFYNSGTLYKVHTVKMTVIKILFVIIYALIRNAMLSVLHNFLLVKMWFSKMSIRKNVKLWKWNISFCEKK